MDVVAGVKVARDGACPRGDRVRPSRRRTRVCDAGRDNERLQEHEANGAARPGLATEAYETALRRRTADAPSRASSLAVSATASCAPPMSHPATACTFPGPTSASSAQRTRPATGFESTRPPCSTPARKPFQLAGDSERARSRVGIHVAPGRIPAAKVVSSILAHLRDARPPSRQEPRHTAGAAASDAWPDQGRTPAGVTVRLPERWLSGLNMRRPSISSG